MLKIDIVSFTYAGALLSEKIKELSGRVPKLSSKACDIRLFTTNQKAGRTGEGFLLIRDDLNEWCAAGFERSDALIFIGACGIAVRTIAPHLKSKLEDPAVIVIDEKGQNVISLLCGHIGGANELCLLLARLLGANPVITTASDINGKIAIDKLAKDNDLFISDMFLAKEAASKIVNGIKLNFYCDGSITGDIPPELIFKGDPSLAGKFDDGPDIIVSGRLCGSKKDLRLIPKNTVIGVGCKRGVLFEALMEHIGSLLDKYKIDKRSITAIASIDIKADEEAILKASEYFSVPFLTFSADELMSVSGDFAGSEFVLNTTGADNICERAAAAAAGEAFCDSYFICKKTLGEGVTAALLSIPYCVRF